MTKYNSDPFKGYTSVNVQKRKDKANETPTGTAKEVLAWVNNDKERAKKSLSLESKETKPRKGLVKNLKEIING